MRKQQGKQLKSALMCCISCILPCGAFDVVRIVHSNGHVQEISGGTTVRAADIMKAYPKHVLKTPTSTATVVVVPPDAELRRGSIYFLIPAAGPTQQPQPQPPPSDHKRTMIKKQQLPSRSSSSKVPSESATTTRSTTRRKHQRRSVESGSSGNKSVLGRANVGTSDQYLSEILSEKVISVGREKRRGRVGLWRPHLESINETDL